MDEKHNPQSDKNHLLNPEYYLNRELSWLEFNARVLEEAGQSEVPALERLKFLMIFTSNLDEFFMVRVAGLKKMLVEDLGYNESPDEMPIGETLTRIRARASELVKIKDDYLNNLVLPELAKDQIKILGFESFNESQQKFLDQYFRNEIFPVLTPLAVDPSHPFPFLSNLSLYMVVTFKSSSKTMSSISQTQGVPPIALVEIPSVLPRLIKVPSKLPGEFLFILLEELIAEHLQELFPGFKIERHFCIRVTRNLDFNLLENEVVDLLKTIQREVTNREHQEAVRLQVTADSPENVVRYIMSMLKLNEDDVYYVDGPLVLSGLKSLYELPFEHLKDPAFNPRISSQLIGPDDFFTVLSKQDLLVHHPYESFYAVTEFLNAAADDPNVLAIKQTLYRTSGDTPIIDTLVRAAENGKQVTAVVELKARFDEKNNISWARSLERSGVNVVFGFVGLKTHCKATLVIRKEQNQMRRYVHLSSGNYNSTTAKLYTDIGFFTSDQEIGQDVAALFNMLTGFNVLTGDNSPELAAAYPMMKKLVLAPLQLRTRLLTLIDEEISFHKQSGAGFIFLKMNALVDRHLIAKLYEASQAGVKIQLIVRGICCLRPGIQGVSDHIKVISIIDRFLEHSRVYYFHSGGQSRVYLSSADWMPRNMDRRIEVLFPVENSMLRLRVVSEILETYWSDNCKARSLQKDGSYVLRKPNQGEKIFRAQHELIKIARERGAKSIPYEKAIQHNPKSKRGKRPVAKKS